ncbi:unnamed protein product [Chondrus crispus]|uniref:RING-type domain-containing protein n=1 Tax=Chondrus crispus TaxID=2769 RepID=R7QVG0_CHOCR|nr:unnamed protein product [Chondrus crispus]CDF41325.1 unnamed protein product [Chondrus crispus]|eukprot:XP_005711619.1 unnamed protein product [Chondrus crispus]
MSPSLLDMPHDAQSQRAIPIVTDEVAKSNLLCPFYALALVFAVALACTLLITFIVDVFSNEFFEPRRFLSHDPAAAKALLNSSCPRYVISKAERESCCICLEQLQQRASVRKLPCRHVYHTRCIDRWLLECSNRCCLCGEAAVKNKCIEAVANNLC